MTVHWFFQVNSLQHLHFAMCNVQCVLRKDQPPLAWKTCANSFTKTQIDNKAELCLSRIIIWAAIIVFGFLILCCKTLLAKVYVEKAETSYFLNILVISIYTLKMIQKIAKTLIWNEQKNRFWSAVQTEFIIINERVAIWRYIFNAFTRNARVNAWNSSKRISNFWYAHNGCANSLMLLHTYLI